MNLIVQEKRRLSQSGDHLSDLIRRVEATGARFWIDRVGRLRIDFSRKKTALPEDMISALCNNEDVITERIRKRKAVQASLF